MRYIIFCVMLLTFAAGGFCDEPAAVRVMSFNIRYDNPHDGDNRWPRRTRIVHQQIAAAEADFIGMQEVRPNQYDDLAKMIGDDYDALQRTRQVDPARGEACTLWWRSDRWRLDPDDHGTFWLSESPDQPGSKSWDSALPRICTWGRFIHQQTGRTLYVYNTHFDHRGDEARRQSARLIAGRIKQRKHADDPVILTGDFNAGEQSVPINTLREAGFVDTFGAVHPDESIGTFGAWVGKTDGARIDYIFTLGELRAVAAKVHTAAIDGRWPSDHFAVTATLERP